MPTRLAVVFLALGCLAASAVGGFFAGRQTTPAPLETAASAPELPGSEAVAPPENEPSSPEINGPAKGDVEPRETTSAEPSRQSAERSSPPVSTESAQTARRDVTPARAPASAPARTTAPTASRVLVEEPAAATGPVAPPSPAVTPVPAPAPLPEPLPLADAIGPSVVPEPITPAHVEVVVKADSVMGLRITDTISTQTAQVEDNVEARITRDVRVDGTVAIPAGARARGSVTVVERGGRFKDRARIGIRFHTLILPDNSELPVSTETLFRVGDAPGNQSATKVGGGAVLGALIGAIIGGGKGAAIGAASGAGAGTAAVMASDISEATFPAGTEVTARLLAPVSVVIEP